MRDGDSHHRCWYNFWVSDGDEAARPASDYQMRASSSELLITVCIVTSLEELIALN